MVLWMVLYNDFSEVYEHMAERKDALLKEFPELGYGGVMAQIAEEFKKIHDTKWFNSLYIDILRDYFSSYYNLTVFIGLAGASAYEDVLRTIVTTEGRTFYYRDIDDTYSDKRYQFIDRHPNKLGHQKIADSVYQYIVTNNLIPCQ